MKNIISLGAGVQSSTMALMALHGELGPMPDAAIFADTQGEPELVYEWLLWLAPKLCSGFPVLTVSKGNLAEKSTTVRTSKKTGLTYIKSQVPAFTLYPNGKKGMMGRHCTLDFKIAAFRSKAKEIAGRGNRLRAWIGISIDEVSRMKDSPDKRIDNYYPLIDKRMSRQDCIDWMESKGYPRPPRSACLYCPFHDDDEWDRMQRETPSEFQEAIAFEKKLQAAVKACPRLDSVPYLHESRIPLNEVIFKPGQKQGHFQNECQGMCGV